MTYSRSYVRNIITVDLRTEISNMRKVCTSIVLVNIFFNCNHEMMRSNPKTQMNCN